MNNPTSSCYYSALMTDLYQLSMAYGYWKSKKYQQEAVFHLYYRKPPFGEDYVVTSGLDTVIQFLENFRYTWDDIVFLGRQQDSKGAPLFDEGFLNYLQRFQFQCSIDAVPEGSIVFPNQPILRIKGPLLQAQLIETALLTIINFSSLISTKATRVVRAAAGDPVLEFGFRRAQGLDGAVTASRAAYIGGCHATSNTEAGKKYDIPVRGTHAHSWVMAFDSEQEAFDAFANYMPGNCTLLVDTYDTTQGVKNAIRTGLKLREKGYDLLGIRLDSGDLTKLSLEARALLDNAGFQKTQIIASNDLDEYSIEALKKEGAAIQVWGVGTRLVTAYDQPALGGVYKLGAIQNQDTQAWDYKIKFSEQLIKVSTPGILQTRRYALQGKPVADVLYSTLQKSEFTSLVTDKDQQVCSVPAWDEAQESLVPIFEKGKKVYTSPNTRNIRQYAKTQTTLFESLEKPYLYGLDAPLYELKAGLLSSINPNLD